MSNASSTLTPSGGVAGPIQQAAGRLQVFGIVLVVLGVLAMIAPMASGVAIAYLVGALVLIGGIARLLFAFSASTFGEGALAFLIGLLMVIGGIALLTHPLLNLVSLTLLLAIYFAVTGVFAVVHAFQMKPAAGWGMVLLNGVVTLLLALVIWSSWPISGTWAIGVLVGVQLLMTGFQLLAVSGAVKQRMQTA